MLQSKSRLLELNAKLAATLTSKGVTATADETTTALVNKVADITSGDDSVLRGLMQRNVTEIVIPYGVESIGVYTFYCYYNLKNINLPSSVKIINDRAFQGCSNLEKVVLEDGLKKINNRAFHTCTNLKTINLPSSLESISNEIFYQDTNLEFLTLGDGFNANNLNLSASTLYARETIVSWLNALSDRTGQPAYKLTIGATNLAKLTEEDILIATNKNWTLA